MLAALLAQQAEHSLRCRQGRRGGIEISARWLLLVTAVVVVCGALAVRTYLRNLDWQTEWVRA